MSRPEWKFGDVLRKAQVPEYRAIFIAWSGADFYVAMLYSDVYAYGDVVLWLLGSEPSEPWEKVDD